MLFFKNSSLKKPRVQKSPTKTKKTPKKVSFKTNFLPAFQNSDSLKKQAWSKNHRRQCLFEELLKMNAFVGDLLVWTHFSQQAFVTGYRNHYSFLNLHRGIYGLQRGLHFLKKTYAKKGKSQKKILFVGHPFGSKESLNLLFHELKIPFFSNNEWTPGFLSKSKPSSVLVIYNINLNYDALTEAVRGKIPVLAFVSASSDLRGVDYPISLNLDSYPFWYFSLWKAFFRSSLILPLDFSKTKDWQTKRVV